MSPTQPPAPRATTTRARAQTGSKGGVGFSRPVSPEVVLDAAARLVELHGVEALTMRRLADELGVAVTSIYWHVGNRVAVLDGLVDRVLAGMEALPVADGPPAERIASLARALRAALRDRPHLVGLAHERDRTPAMFLPVQQAMARELAVAGWRGADAALFLRGLQGHVVSSVLLERSAARNASHSMVDPGLWPSDWDDQELVAELARPADYDAVFEFGLAALLAGLDPR